MDSFLYDDFDEEPTNVVAAITAPSSSLRTVLDVDEIERSINSVLCEALANDKTATSPTLESQPFTVGDDTDDGSSEEEEHHHGTIPFEAVMDKVVNNYCSMTFRQQLRDLHEQWKQLDELYLLPSDSKSGGIALPDGFDYKVLENLHDIDGHVNEFYEEYNHPRYPTDKDEKQQYLVKLFSIIKSVPKVSLMNDIFASNTLETVKLLGDYENRSKITLDCSSFQPAYVVFDEEISKKRRRVENFAHSSVTTLSTTIITPPTVYSVGIYSTTTNTIQQRLQLLGHHTLSQLQKLIYCVQKEIHRASSNNWSALESSVATTVDVQNYGTYSFFINGSMYYDHSCLSSQQMVDKTKSSLQAILQKMKDESQSILSQVPLLANSQPRPKRRGSLADSALLAAALLERMTENQATTLSGRKSSTSTKKKRNIPSGIALPSPVATSSPMVAVPTAMVEVNPHGCTLSLSINDNFPNVPSADVATLDSLNLKVGVAYLFTHCYSCEHLVVVNEIRDYHSLLDGDDLSKYPCTLSKMYGKKRRCQACEAFGAAFIIFNDRLAETNPCFLCQMCNQSLHYDRSGRLIYDDFLIYPYLHDTPQ